MITQTNCINCLPLLLTSMTRLLHYADNSDTEKILILIAIYEYITEVILFYLSDQ